MLHRSEELLAHHHIVGELRAAEGPQVSHDRRERGPQFVRGRRNEVVLSLVQVPELGDGLLFPGKEIAQLVGLLPQVSVLCPERPRGPKGDRQQEGEQDKEPRCEGQCEGSDERVDVALERRVVLIQLGDRDDGPSSVQAHRHVALEELVRELSFPDVLPATQIRDAAYDLAHEDLAELGPFLREGPTDERRVIRVEDCPIPVPDLHPNIPAIVQDPLRNDRVERLEGRARERPVERDPPEHGSQDRLGDELRVKGGDPLRLLGHGSDHEDGDARPGEQEGHECPHAEEDDQVRCPLFEIGRHLLGIGNPGDPMSNGPTWPEGSPGNPVALARTQWRVEGFVARYRGEVAAVVGV